MNFIQKNFKGFFLNVKLKGQDGTMGILGASGCGKSNSGLLSDCDSILADWKIIPGNRRTGHCDSRRNGDYLLLD